MKAIVCNEFGPIDKLAYADVPAPEVKEGLVRIQVRAAGVNFPDILMVKGEYQFKPPFPFSPGAEVAGDVVEVGDGVTDLKVGDRVIGMCGAGAFAQEVVTPAARCIKLPDTMDYDVGSILSMTYGTSYYALVQRAQLQAGETLLVHAASGGVGSAAVDIGLQLGAKIIATGGSDDKLQQLSKHYGVDKLINYRSETPLKEQVKAMTDGKGADVIYDSVGGDVMMQSLRCVNWNGRILVIGFTSGEIPKIPANLALLKSSSIVGVFWGAWTGREPQENLKNFDVMFGWHAEGKLRPIISHRAPLKDAVGILEAIANREVVGKAILTVD